MFGSSKTQNTSGSTPSPQVEPPKESGFQKALGTIANKARAVYYRIIQEPWQADYIEQRIESAPSKIVWLSEDAKQKLRIPEEPDSFEEFGGIEGGELQDKQASGGMWSKFVKAVKHEVGEVKEAAGEEGKRLEKIAQNKGLKSIPQEEIFVELRDLTCYIESMKANMVAEESKGWGEELTEWVRNFVYWAFGKGGISANMQLSVNLSGSYGFAAQKAAQALGSDKGLKGDDQVIALQTIHDLKELVFSLKNQLGNAAAASELQGLEERLKALEVSALGANIASAKEFMGEEPAEGFLKGKTKGVYSLRLVKQVEFASLKIKEEHPISVNIETNTIYDAHTGTHQFSNKEELQTALQEKVKDLGCNRIESYEITKFRLP